MTHLPCLAVSPSTRLLLDAAASWLAAGSSPAAAAGYDDVVDEVTSALADALGDGPLVTDRPDFTESAVVVPGGRFQLESGYTFSTARGAGSEHAIGEVLFRIGIARRAELRVGVNSFGIACVDGDCATGMEDSSLGIKLQLVDNEGALPGVGLLLGTTLPTGSEDGFGQGPLEPSAVVALAWDLSDAVALGANVGYAYTGDAGDRFSELSGSLAFGFGLSDRVGVFAEYFGFYPLVDGASTAHFGNGGVTLLASDDLQFDLRAGGGADGSTPALFAGAGISWRR